MATPTPLPSMATLRLDDPAVKTAFENLVIYLSRTRDVLYDSSTTDSLGSAIAGLQGRSKDIYTFGIPGTVGVTEPDTMGLSLPHRVVADSTVLEARADLFAGTGTQVAVYVDGVVAFTLTAGAGNHTPGTVLTKDSVLSAYVFEPGLFESADAQGLTVQIRCG